MNEEHKLGLSRSSQMAHNPESGPPFGELPAVLPTPYLVWRSEHTVVAISSLEIYHTGVEFTMRGYTKDAAMAHQFLEIHWLSRAMAETGVDCDPEELHFNVRSRDEVLSVKPLDSTTRGGQFWYRAWIADTDVLEFSLVWLAASISYAEHEVADVPAVADRATRLWPSTSKSPTTSL